jgi:Rrf2 family transcriptional regulator, cysteine metabolism repressor
MRTLPFSAKAEYACIAMLELAANYGRPQPVPLKSIAETHHIPQRFLVQILLQLKGSGLVVSTRGAAGGYLLGRSPKTITLADVLNVIDRQDRPVPDRPGNSGGPRSPMADALRGVWKEIASTQHRLLAGTTLAELAQKAREGQALVYQI